MVLKIPFMTVKLHGLAIIHLLCNDYTVIIVI
jgi:hypothetical protein